MNQLNKDVLVNQVMLPLTDFVVLKVNELFRTAIEQMSEKRLGIVCIVDQEGVLVGVFTDGDIRRLLLRDHKPLGAFFVEDIGDHMTANPKQASPEMPLVDAVSLMETADIYDLPVVDAHGKLIGLLHMHTALRYLLGL